jgi:single-strand DNA-binding protein
MVSMATGQAAEKAAQQADKDDQAPSKDLGPGSVSGNLTRDPDLTFTGSGHPVSNLRVADTPRVKDPKTGKWQDGETVYYGIAVFGALAENVAQNLSKGDRIVAEGRWTQSTWKDEEGTPHERIVLTARDLGPSMLFRGARVLRKGE